MVPTPACQPQPPGGCSGPLPGSWGRGALVICLVNAPPLALRTLLAPEWVGGGCPTLTVLSCPAGAQGIVNSGLIPALVWKLQREEENIRELLLDMLAACLMEDATEALDSRLVPFLKEKLLSANNNIRSKAARTLVAIRLGLAVLWGRRG